MNRRELMICIGAATITTQIPLGVSQAAGKELSSIIDKSDYIYTIFENWKGDGRDLHDYKDRQIMVTRDFEDGVKATTGYDFKFVNKASINSMLDGENVSLSEVHFTNPYNGIVHSVKRTIAEYNFQKTSHGEPYDTLYVSKV